MKRIIANLIYWPMKSVVEISKVCLIALAFTGMAIGFLIFIIGVCKILDALFAMNETHIALEVFAVLSAVCLFIRWLYGWSGRNRI